MQTVTPAPAKFLKPEVTIEDVQGWIDNAASFEIAQLDFPGPGLFDEDEDENDTIIRINCGSDAGSLYDLQRIQELCNGLHVSDILARLAA